MRPCLDPGPADVRGYTRQCGECRGFGVVDTPQGRRRRRDHNWNRGPFILRARDTVTCKACKGRGEIEVSALDEQADRDERRWDNR